jgi:Zn-dependent membrane protease YugP
MLMFDPMYFLIVAPAILLSLWAQFKVKSTFSKYSHIGTSSELTGAHAARKILENNGIYDVDVKETMGWLSDHYDPKHKVLKLSPKVYHDASIASIGVAAHEAGHAIQHHIGYAPLMVRQTIAPAAMAGSNIAMVLLMVGFIIGALGLIKIGIIAFSLAVLFQLITLPVEFDASRRAKNQLQELGIVNMGEVAGVSKVLSAAGLTYVAAALAAILQLIYFLFRAGLLGGRRND